jgi:hypothetical protein
MRKLKPTKESERVWFLGSHAVLVTTFSVTKGRSNRSLKTKVNASRGDFLAIYLNGFQGLCGRYPKTAEGLAALAKKLPSKCDMVESPDLQLKF